MADGAAPLLEAGVAPELEAALATADAEHAFEAEGKEGRAQVSTKCFFRV